MKKLSADSIMSFVVAVLIAVSLAVTEISFHTAQGWFDDENVNSFIILLAILAAILMIAYGIITTYGIKEDSSVNKIGKDIMAAGAAACMGIVAGMIISAIATEFAYTFLSDFNAGTAKAEFMPGACIQATVGIVLALVTVLAIAINGIFKKN